MQTDKQILAAGQSRLHGLDAVRALALLLGVVLHAAMSFLPGPQVWLVDDTQSSIFLAVTFFVIHMLRMVTFFLIAGYVARLSFHKLGQARFFRDRALRIGVPLVLGWLLLFPALMAAAGIPRTAWSVSFGSFPLIHLWFLYLLGLFYLGLAVLQPVLARVSGRVTHWLLQPWALGLLATPLCLSLYLHPYWVMWFGIPTPDRSFLPTMPSVLGFGVAFLFGWMSAARPDALGTWASRWPLNLTVAGACTVLCLAQTGLSPLLMPAPQGGVKFLFAASYSLGAWSWALALAGIGQRFLSEHSPARRYLADASYWIYLVHLPLVVLLQQLVAPLAWPWPLKMLLILAAAFGAMLASYALLVRRTVVGAVLNGRRKN
jgi:glucans biosynthesis protein C